MDNSTASKFLLVVGIFFAVVGFSALIVLLLRDVFGVYIPIKGNLIPLSILTVMGAGLIIASRRESGK